MARARLKRWFPLMRPPLIFDCHLDLSLNALEYNRDLRLPVPELRRREQGMIDLKGREKGTTAFPEMRAARMGLCVATQLAGCMVGGATDRELDVTSSGLGADAGSTGVVSRHGGGRPDASDQESH